MYIAEHHNNYLHCTVSIAYIVNQQASTESWQCYRSVGMSTSYVTCW